MIHQFRDKKQIAQRRRAIRNIIIFVIFLVLSGFGIFAYLNNTMQIIARPIWKIENKISESVDSVGYIVRSKVSVFKENERLSTENTELRTIMTDYNVLKDENIKLKEMLGRVTPEKNIILSSILTKPSYSPYDSIIIDVGEDVNIKVGGKVYANEIIPIGKVKSVYKNTSVVELYSSPGTRTSAVMNESNTPVELIGRGGGNFEMAIPLNLSFIDNTEIVMPGIRSEVLAITKEVISTSNDPVKKILLSSPVNIQNLKWVFVDRN